MYFDEIEELEYKNHEVLSRIEWLSASATHTQQNVFYTINWVRHTYPQVSLSDVSVLFGTVSSGKLRSVG